MSPRLAFALDAVFRAGRATLAHFQTGVKAELKGDDSPVTVADRETERMLRSDIARHFPGEAILGEEEGASGSSEARWVIDPIDGTKSFVCGVPLYGVLLSFEQAQRPIIGIAYFPALDEMVWAERGLGTFWNGRKCFVSSQNDLRRATLLSGSMTSLENRNRLEGYLALARKAAVSRTWGDAYGHVLIATGRAEIMLDPVVSPWDISACTVIVEEAGGQFTGFDGQAHPTNEAVASNGLLHAEALDAFR